MSYHDQLKKDLILRLREKLATLPGFVGTFLYGIEDRTSARTRLGYATDLSLFFNFLVNELCTFDCGDPKDFTIEQLKAVTPEDIQAFMQYLSLYIRKIGGSEIERVNEERGKSRKLYAVRSMFSYLYKHRQLPANPAVIVDSPKLHEKAKTYLEPNEVARLLDEIESGADLTEHQLRYHQYTKTRDLAIITLLLGTGIRISELVGLDIQHINFEDGSFLITRKGGNQAILYFNEEVEGALGGYLDEREQIAPLAGHEDALFLSMRRRRVTDRAVQLLVKKYSRIITPLKRITPHKLRTTFGTDLYQKTSDIYLVADILGHHDVNTTRKHYADASLDNRRAELRNVKLRED